jgi:hypothetical protein
MNTVFVEVHLFVGTFTNTVFINSGVPEFTPVFCWIRVAQSLALFCRSLFVRMSCFVFNIVLSVFPFTLTADLFEIFNVSY